MGKRIVVRAPRHAAVKRKDKLVEIVCQNERKQHGWDDGQHADLPGQTVFLRFPERQGNENAEQRDKQHGEIVEVPDIPRRSRIGDHFIFERAQQEPHQHQQGSQAQTVQHLLLGDALIEGKAPQSKQQQVKRRADIARMVSADAEHGEHPARIRRRNDRKNKEHREQASDVSFHGVKPSLSLR